MLWSPGLLNSGRTRFYGMGWMINPPGGVPMLYHPGASVGYGGCIVRYENPKITVIVLTNLYGAAPEVVARRVAEAYEPSYVSKPPILAADPKPERTNRVKSSLEKLSASGGDPDLMEPEFIAPLKTSRARMFPQFRDFAKIESLGYAGEWKQGTDTMLVYRLKNERRTLSAYVLWSEQGKLAQIYLRADPG